GVEVAISPRPWVARAYEGGGSLDSAAALRNERIRSGRGGRLVRAASSDRRAPGPASGHPNAPIGEVYTHTGLERRHHPGFREEYRQEAEEAEEAGRCNSSCQPCSRSRRLCLRRGL